MATKISFFNHKGGVSKTTSAYHLAWMLTNKKKRVLLVDADSQCNLTLLALGDCAFEDFYQQNPFQNIKSALSSAFESKPELIKPVDCISVKGNEKLLLLPGSFELSEYEVQLGVSFQLSHSFSTMKNLPGSLNYLIEKTAERYNIDIVIIDMNPSLSAINQDLLIISDYFIVPTSADYFSIMAINSLARILPRWEHWAKQARTMFDDATYKLSKNTPKFLGYTVNDFNIKNKKPTINFQKIIETISDTVKQTLIPNLSKEGMLLPSELYVDYCLGNISTFNTLQAKYQEYGVPIFELTDSQIGSTINFQNQKDSIERFKNLFSTIADNILKMIQND